MYTNENQLLEYKVRRTLLQFFNEITLPIIIQLKTYDVEIRCNGYINIKYNNLYINTYSEEYNEVIKYLNARLDMYTHKLVTNLEGEKQ